MKLLSRPEPQLRAVMTDSSVTVFVCVSCRRMNPDGEGFHHPGRALADALRDRLAHDAPITVTPVECLAVCNRPGTIALVGSGKWTYLIGNLDTDAHLDQIVESARAYLASENGIIPWKERPEAFRKGVVARVPPLGFSHPEQDPS
jgi:predicted metal-binding protein